MADLDLIKSKLDIVDVVLSYLPDLKKAGANYKTNCPFHNEKTPSFMVNPSLQLFKCFGCGKAGDAITFIKEIERVEFKEAIQIAAERAGVDISQNNQYQNNVLKKLKERIIEANTLAAKFFNYILSTHKSGKAGRDYAQKRGIDAARISKFVIGYAPNKTDNLKKFLLSKGFTEKELLEFGLLVERDKKLIDKFRHRLMQPVFSTKGEVIGFSGRYIGTFKDAPKYLNSPETPVYKKNQILYGLYHAKDSIRKNGFVILEEGNIDVLSSHRVGIENIVAPLGTAFTENQAALLKKYTDTVYFCFDTDNAGIAALTRGIGILENTGLKYKVINIDNFQDPDDLISKSPELWSEKVSAPVDAVEYLINRFAKAQNLSTSEGKNNFAEQIVPVLRSIKNPISFAHYLNEVSMLVDVNAQIFEERFISKPTFRQNKSTIQQVESVLYSKTMPENEVKLLSFIIQNFKKINIKNFVPEVFSDSRLKQIFTDIEQNFHGDNISEVALMLSEDIKEIFSELVLKDLTRYKSAVETAQRLYSSLLEKYLRKEILNLRKKVATDDEEAIGELASKTKELKSLLQKFRSK